MLLRHGLRPPQCGIQKVKRAGADTDRDVNGPSVRNSYLSPPGESVGGETQLSGPADIVERRLLARQNQLGVDLTWIDAETCSAQPVSKQSRGGSGVGRRAARPGEDLMRRIGGVTRRECVGRSLDIGLDPIPGRGSAPLT